MNNPTFSIQYASLSKLLENELEANVVLSMVTSFEISHNPKITVESRGHDKWAICWSNCCYSPTGSGDWVSEGLPSGRSDDFIAATRFGLRECFGMLDVAYSLAEKWQDDAATQLLAEVADDYAAGEPSADQDFQVFSGQMSAPAAAY